MSSSAAGRIVVGVSASVPGQAALRYAVAEARRRRISFITPYEPGRIRITAGNRHHRGPES